MGQARCGSAGRTTRKSVRHRTGRHTGRTPLPSPRPVRDRASLLAPAAGRQLRFASEVRPLAQLAPGQSRVDDAAAARYLRYGAIRSLSITAVPPNSVAIVGKDRHVEVRPVRPDGPATVKQRPSDLGAALAESVGLHMGADVRRRCCSPGRGFGGCRGDRPPSRQDLHCLTVAADGAPDETVAAAQTARHYGHRFQRVQIVLEEATRPGSSRRCSVRV